MHMHMHLHHDLHFGFYLYLHPPRRQDSESESELLGLRSNGGQNGSCGSIDSAGVLCGGQLSRPITPAFPQVTTSLSYSKPSSPSS